MTDIQVKLMIGTPSRGSVGTPYVRSLLALRGAIGPYSWTCSRARTCPEARAEIVHDFLNRDVTHLLFIDGDMEFSPDVVKSMLMTGHPVVGCSYPGRASTAKDIRMLAKLFPESEREDPRMGCIRVAALGLGLTLIRRDVLEAMVKHYGPELRYTDERTKISLVGLFHEELKEGALTGEDFMFFNRWRAIGGEVWLLVDAPLTHHFETAVTGNVRDVLFPRTEMYVNMEAVGEAMIPDMTPIKTEENIRLDSPLLPERIVMNGPAQVERERAAALVESSHGGQQEIP